MAAIYQTDVSLPSFAGINQTGDGANMSMRYATDAENCDVTGGALSPMREGFPLAQTIASPIGTLARLHRRWHTQEDEKDLLVAIAGGRVWTKLLDHTDEWASRFGGLSTDVCDFVAYEVNRAGSTAPTDVLLFTNAVDGMYCLYGDDLTVAPVTTPKKFGVLARHADRIWGAGITGDPDMLVYSAPFDPFNWTQNTGIPEDGAGDIQQPSWDGDSFLALRPFGSQLLAFKKNTIWRILGTNPGEYVMKEQYGMGAISENTIVVNGAQAFMLGYRGIMRYDGASTLPYQQSAVRRIMERRSPTAMSAACAVMRDNTYCLALPLDGSTVNNAVLEYNLTEQTFSLRTGIYPESFLGFEDRVFYTTSTTPGTVYEMGKGEVLPLTWASGYQDLGAKDVVKSSFTVYLRPSSDSANVPLTVRIRTEKKVKEKTLTLAPGKAKRISLAVSGRYFRLELASSAASLWTLSGGIQIHCELDPD